MAEQTSVDGYSVDKAVHAVAAEGRITSVTISRELFDPDEVEQLQT